MRQYMFHPVALLRSPAYPFSHARELSLQEHLDAVYFRNGLFIAAPALFNEIRKSSFLAGNLRPKAIKALWNYLNRLYYRTTPFGMFSGFSTVKWQGAQTEARPLVFGGRQLHVMAEIKEEPPALSFEKTSDEAVLLFTNPSLYQAGDELRYLKSEYDSHGHRYRFQVAAIADHELLHFALGLCMAPTSLGVLKKAIKKQLPVTEQQLYQALTHLVGENLLLWKRDYTLLHVGRAAQVVLPGKKLREADLTQEMRNSYTTLHFELREGNIAREQQLKIKCGLDALHAICPHIEPAGLKKFIADFERKFEGRAIPLMVALDPELGIGYRGLEHSYYQPPMLEGLDFPPKEPTTKQLEWSNMHAVLLKKMQAAPGLRTSGIILEDIDLDSGSSDGKPLPPGLSVLFRPLHDEVFIESAGGATATALFGRFSIFDDCLADTLRTIADNEVRHNPAVVFAEINCIQDLHAANVEHRISAYPYEIPLLTYPSAPSDRIIALSELWVSVRDGRIVLWSERLQKEVIPRLSSAFNHSRSHLHVYRFLCDLQYQGIKTNFTLDLSHFFPNLDFYPRVSYRGAILSLACWNLALPIHILKQRQSDNSKAKALRNYLREQQVPRYFATYNGDQQLVYDAGSDADLIAFLGAIAVNGKVSIKEFPFPCDKNPVRDMDGRAYLPQYLNALLRSECIYRGDISGQAATAALYHSPRQGDDWIYFKVYCHPHHSRMILEEIAGLLEEGSEPAMLIARFFYVIYEDPGYHLRLRFQPARPANRAAVIMVLEACLQRFRSQGLVSAIQVEQYQREIERYGLNNINLIEEIFDADTRWILDMAAVTCNLVPAPTECIATAAAILEAFGLPLQQKTEHCELVFESLFTEFGGDRNLRLSLGHKYRKEKKALGVELDTMISLSMHSPHYRRMTKLINKLVSANVSPESIPLRGLMTDIIHMHLNRVFTQQPRQQEMVVHFMLANYYKSLYYRQHG